MKKKLCVLAVCIAATVVFMLAAMVSSGNTNVAMAEEQAKEAKPKKAAVERSRKAVQTLDNIFKQTIVLVTDKYVH
ncbi:MAG: hypothetical protein KDB05_24905, partial [Planctomycetales bacterium]|nr:hypothetical protein [Planctomycetales bacterium]